MYARGESIYIYSIICLSFSHQWISLLFWGSFQHVSPISFPFKLPPPTEACPTFCWTYIFSFMPWTCPQRLKSCAFHPWLWRLWQPQQLGWDQPGLSGLKYESWTVRLLGFSWPGSLSVIRFAFSSWEGSMPIPFIQMSQESHPIIPNLIQCHLISSHLISSHLSYLSTSFYLIASYLVLSCCVLFLSYCFDLSYLYPLLSDDILSYSIWSYPIKFYPVLSTHLYFN